MAETPEPSAPQAPEAPTETASPETVHLSREDALLVENAQLKITVAGQDMEQARQSFARAMRAQADLTARISNDYKVDATRYVFNPEAGTLVLRRPTPVPPTE